MPRRASNRLGLAAALAVLIPAGPAAAQSGPGINPSTPNFWNGSAWVPVTSAAPLPVTAAGGGSSPPYQYTDLGPCQITVGNAATALTGGTGICSSSIPAGATAVVITVETESIRWTGTGATNPPTQSFGNLAPVGSSFTYSATLSGFRMNDTSAGSSTVDVEFFK